MDELSDRFKGNADGILSIAGEIITAANEKKVKTSLSPTLFSIGRNFIGKADGKLAIESFIQSSAQYWDSAFSKDEKLIVENADILFRELPIELVKEFSRLYVYPGLVSEETKKEIWAFVHAMIKQSIRYVHLGRVPTTNPAGSPRPFSYAKTFFPSIKLAEQAGKWGVKL